MGRVNRRHEFVDDKSGKGIWPVSVVMHDVGVSAHALGNQERSREREILCCLKFWELHLGHAQYLQPGVLVAHWLRFFPADGYNLHFMSLGQQSRSEICQVRLDAANLGRKTG